MNARAVRTHKMLVSTAMRVHRNSSWMLTGCSTSCLSRFSSLTHPHSPVMPMVADGGDSGDGGAHSAIIYYIDVTLILSDMLDSAPHGQPARRPTLPCRNSRRAAFFWRPRAYRITRRQHIDIALTIQPLGGASTGCDAGCGATV